MIFSNICKLYFLNLKEEKKYSLQNFRSWKNNKFYDDFFKKVKACQGLIGSKVIGDNDRQRKRAYTLFKSAVS